MKKETLIALVSAIENQIKVDNTLAKKLSEAYPNAFSANLLKSTVLIEDVITALHNEFEDIGHMIEYFIYDMEFGSINNKVEINGKTVRISNLDELWNYLLWGDLMYATVDGKITIKQGDSQ